MGFASSFKMMTGLDQSIVTQLLAFNCGLELGQILIVLTMVGILYLFTKYLKTKPREWNLFISGIGFGIGMMVLLNSISNF